MYVVNLETIDRPTEAIVEQLSKLKECSPSFVLLYGVEQAPLRSVLDLLRRQLRDVPLFGATSFRGMFTSSGFHRDVSLLVGEPHDEIATVPVLQRSTAARARDDAAAACRRIQEQLQMPPSLLLLHATPGFEERILEGVQRYFENKVPVFGGSAADDHVAGNWSVFEGNTLVEEGFLLVGLHGPREPRGAFLAGYLPTGHSGTVSAVDGRAVMTIDGRPAAKVYDEWTGGAISADLKTGGDILSKTNLLPVARTLSRQNALPHRLLSHPFRVEPHTQALSFFTEFNEGDVITLMTSTKDPLVGRVKRTVQRARGPRNERVRGGLLVYCGGCLSVQMDQADQIASEFRREVNDAPFVGIATFGEQGAFFSKAESWHGNLMCSTILF